MKAKATILFLLFSLTAAPALAETRPPVEISAEKSLEWNRKEKTYTANENVMVTQGDVKMQGDKMVARYTDDEDAANISIIEMTGNVTVHSPAYRAQAPSAVYDAKTGKATLKGRGVVTHGSDTLTADALEAYLDDAGGDLEAKKITARGNVVIATKRETVTGDAGVYDVPTQKAELTGNVVIQQGKNRLEGTRAMVDMKTGVSQLLADQTTPSGGRVKGVFYPKSVPKKEGP